MSKKTVPAIPSYRVVDRLAVEVHPTRVALGRAAALAAAATIRKAISSQGYARVVFGSAPSQDEFIDELVAASKTQASGFDWSKVVAFHMDEYIGVKASQRQSFRYYLNERLFKHVKVGKFHEIKGESPDLKKVFNDYARLIGEKPIDLICMGVGENGHIAFNDPPVADFEDSELIKIVGLDLVCRKQQVADGGYPTLDQVPTNAISLTVSVFRHARNLSVHVPGPRKAKAVRATLHDKISTKCPATILRTHPSATLYLDADSAKLI